MPAIAFDANKNKALNWNHLIQKNVLGPFAPRSGWIGQEVTNGHKYTIKSEEPDKKIKNIDNDIHINIKSKAIRLKVLALQQKVLNEHKLTKTLKYEEPNDRTDKRRMRNPNYIYCGSKVV